MFIQDVTPDTSGYMIAGFVISFVVMGLYVASMYLRARSLRQDQSLLEEMEKEARSPAEPKRPASPLGEKSTRPVTKKST
jgi:hypothetical protein